MFHLQRLMLPQINYEPVMVQASEDMKLPIVIYFYVFLSLETLLVFVCIST
jgi:hypothetical protein